MRFIAIVMIGLAAPSWGCDGDCVVTRQKTFDIAMPTDPQMQFRLERCQADIATCVQVCALAMDRAGMGTNVSECDVEIDTDTATVVASYDEYVGGLNCPVAEDDEAGPVPDAARGRGGL